MNQWKMLVSALVLIPAALPCYAADIHGSSGKFEATLQMSFSMGSGAHLELDGVTGDIELRARDQNEVDLQIDLVMEVLTKAEAEEIMDRISGSVTQEDNRLVISGPEGLKNVQCRYSFKVPRTIHVRAETRAGDVSAEGLRADLELNSRGGDLAVKAHAGQARLLSSGGDIALSGISGTLHASTAGGDIDMEEIHGDTQVETRGGDISVASASAKIAMVTAGGDINISRATDRVSARTLGGDIEVSGCSGSDLSLETEGGDIELQAIGSSVSARTQGGDIQGADLDGALSVRTAGGDIDLGRVRAPVKAHCANGDIQIEVTLSDFSKPHHMELNSISGDISLILPAGLPAQIDAKVRSSGSQRIGENYDIYSDFPLAREPGDETGAGWLRSKGEINGGGDLIRLNAQRGDITIKKSE